MDKFETLNDETAILMINQDTFTVARLKELIQNKLNQRLSQSHEGRYTSIADYLRNDLSIIEGQVGIRMRDFQLRFPPEGQECKRLNFETKEWETGKLRIFADLKIVPPIRRGYAITIEMNQFILEFAPEQPTFEYESPLDEIRNSFS